MKKLILFFYLLISKCTFAQDTTKVLMQIYYRDWADTAILFTTDTRIIDIEQAFGYVIRKNDTLYYRREDFTLLPENAFVFKAMKNE